MAEPMDFRGCWCSRPGAPVLAVAAITSALSRRIAAIRAELRDVQGRLPGLAWFELDDDACRFFDETAPIPAAATRSALVRLFAAAREAAEAVGDDDGDLWWPLSAGVIPGPDAELETSYRRIWVGPAYACWRAVAAWSGPGVPFESAAIPAGYSGAAFHGEEASDD